jgi:hypothetical protein
MDYKITPDPLRKSFLGSPKEEKIKMKNLIITALSFAVIAYLVPGTAFAASAHDNLVGSDFSLGIDQSGDSTMILATETGGQEGVLKKKPKKKSGKYNDRLLIGAGLGLASWPEHWTAHIPIGFDIMGRVWKDIHIHFNYHFWAVRNTIGSGFVEIRHVKKFNLGADYDLSNLLNVKGKIKVYGGGGFVYKIIRSTAHQMRTSDNQDAYGLYVRPGGRYYFNKAVCLYGYGEAGYMPFWQTYDRQIATISIQRLHYLQMFAGAAYVFNF